VKLYFPQDPNLTQRLAQRTNWDCLLKEGAMCLVARQGTKQEEEQWSWT